MNNYEDFMIRKIHEYGSKFDSSNLNLDFMKYYENNKRIKVKIDGKIVNGFVGVTTGWRPVFILMRTKRSIGSSYIIGKDTIFIKELNY